MKEKLASLVRSRRFWLAVAGIVATAGHQVFGISEQQTLEVAGIVIAWILGDSMRKTQ